MMDGFSDNVPQLTLTTPNRLHIASILRRAATAREGPSRLGVLWGLHPPPLSLVDMLHVTGGGFGS